MVQETRLYDPERDETRAMRGKEEAHDYRYFPDPDLLPVAIDPDWIEAVRAELPELPWARRRRFVEALGLAPDQAAQLAADKAAADYFEAVLAEAEGVAPRLAANWVLVNLAGALNRAGLAIGASPVPPPALAVLLRRLADGTLSSKLAKTVFEAVWAGEGDVDEIIERRGLRAEGDRDALAALVDEVVGRHPEQVAQYRAGKTKVLGFFVGQVMKATGGKADPALVNRLLRERLDA
ncbi:MAG: hypothetical protein KatS3mg121_1019 [Gammaproteobacteria bacterium]|nr:MAG: hypothetical protein KatS3mg121_1019 [Gammaproteobacteria bacterium]